MTYRAQRPSVVARRKRAERIDNLKSIAIAIVVVPVLWLLAVIYLSI